jgi:hypothetical protein
MKTSLTIAALALFAATGAMAEPAQDAAAPKAEKKVCKTERVTGSLTRVNKICMTAQEWTALAANSRKALDDISRTTGTAGGASNANGASSGL